MAAKESSGDPGDDDAENASLLKVNREIIDKPKEVLLHEQGAQQSRRMSVTLNNDKGGSSAIKKAKMRRPSLGSGLITRMNSNEKKKNLPGKQKKFEHEKKKILKKKLKFQLVSSRNIDPLNLMGITQKEGYCSPRVVDSPLVNDRGQYFDPDNVRPIDVTDPLKLNNLDDDVLSVKIHGHKRKRKRKRRRTMSENDMDFGVDIETIAADGDTETSDIEGHSPEKPADKEDVLSKIATPKKKACTKEIIFDPNSTDIKTDETAQLCVEKNLEVFKDESPLIITEEKLESTLKVQYERKNSNEKCEKVTFEETGEDKHKNIRFREKNKRYQYGNYNQYYGYRNANMSEDDRIEYMKKEWFDGKNCLDIGCNVGHLTLYIARHYNPKSLLGIDIDDHLISSARNNIRHYVPLQNPQAPKQSDFPISFPICLGPLAAPVLPNKESRSFGFPYNVSFKTENYVDFVWEDIPKIEQKYNFILCLSVTKWIQLNWGDDGVKKMFKKVFLSLHPGGKFLLEPQPWKSYRKKKNITATTRANFDKIKFRPDQYIQYLLSNEIGFASSEQLGIPKHKAQGFQRPIYLLTKGGSSSIENATVSKTEFGADKTDNSKKN